MTAIANARMYAVAPTAEQAWAELLAQVAAEAGVALRYEPYPAPQPMEALWRRPDLGAVFMCGFPIALRLAAAVPLAAPVPDAAWAEGRAVYRSDLVVRADSPFQTLEDTFGGTVGWTVQHSHSGFNALRHHLLAHRRPDGLPLYRASLGGLATPRGVVDALLDGRIDIGPLDAYWHLLLAHHRPDLAARLRVVAATALAPLPALVASPDLPARDAAALTAALVGAAGRPWFGRFARPLRIAGFAAVTRDGYALTRRRAEEAEAAGYPVPA